MNGGANEKDVGAGTYKKIKSNTKLPGIICERCL